MSESFENALTILRVYLLDHNFGCMMANRLKNAHDHELEQARKAEYARGYDDGRRSKDADHASVALRLSRLCFDGGSHENLSKIAYAIYPCATGWTCESSKGLRDRLIDLLGGVRNRDGLVHRCFNACGNPGPRGVGEPTEAITYDELQAKLEEADAAIANWREREKSFEESERERDELKAKLDAIREALDG